MENLFLFAITGLGLGALATFLSLKIFPALGWLDFPERYGLKRDRLPYPGGVVLWLLALVGLSTSEVFRPLMVPVVFLGLISWWDDRKNIAAWFRLMVHVWLAHMPLTLLNLYLAGLCAGAFWFYLKGRIILGDTGSQVLGWLLAVMAIFSGAKIATTLIVLSLPLLDMAWVIFRRMWLQKKSPFKGDLFHLHHLLARQNDATQVTLSLVGFSLLLGLAAVLLPADFKLPGFGIIAVAVLAVNWQLWQRQK